MPNSTSTLKMDMTHPVPTVEVGKPTNHYKSGLAEIRDELVSEGMGPQHRSVLPRGEEMSTGHDISR
jgi:hypothetical protein